jgi:hypothetical protein
MFTGSSRFATSVTTSTVPDYPLTKTLTDIPDGTSNTIALSETVQGFVTNDYRGLLWLTVMCFFNTNQSPNTTVPDLSLCINSHPLHPGAYPNLAAGSPSSYYMRLSARSWHVGGVNVGLGDGSVRFIPNQIDIEVWRAAGSTDGGEVSSLP